MEQTPHTTSWQLGLDIFAYPFRPCRHDQETIYDYQSDGRPQFRWEYLRQVWVFRGDERIAQTCSDCPINIMGEVEGCKVQVDNLDIFFRALNELVPESPWAQMAKDGSPLSPGQMAQMLHALGELRSALELQTWPVAVPRYSGNPYYEEIQEPDENGDWATHQGAQRFYAWNGEGPPGLIFLNEGYSLYLSRHGLMVKPTGEDPVPYVFRRLWREDLGVFGEDGQAQQIGFDVLSGRYPSWGFSTDSDTDLTLERMPAAQVFTEILDLLEVFCSVALEFEAGLFVKAPVA